MKNKQWRPKPTLERNKKIRAEYKKLRLEMNATHAIEILCAKYFLSFQSIKNRIYETKWNKINSNYNIKK